MTRGVLAAALAAIFLLLAVSTAQATQFTGGPGVTINDAPADGTVTAATPSPSVINVMGQSGVVKSITIDLSGFIHNSQRDVDVLLEGPGGQVVTLLSDVGGRPAGSATSYDFGVRDGAAQAPTSGPPGNCGTTLMATGFYAPTDNDTPTLDCDALCIADPTLDANDTSLATFNETNPNGSWKLFVYDDCHIEGGSIAGWTLDLTTGPPIPTTTPPSPTPTSPTQSPITKKKCKHKKHKRSATSAKKKCKKHKRR
jgi:subtilisin-like proprotein convertase family protein